MFTKIIYRYFKKPFFPLHKPVYTDKSRSSNCVSINGELVNILLDKAQLLQVRLVPCSWPQSRQRAHTNLHSKPSLQALESLNTKHPIITSILVKVYSLQRQNFKIPFCWISSHMVLFNKEQADSAAKEAPKMGSQIVKSHHQTSNK